LKFDGQSARNVLALWRTKRHKSLKIKKSKYFTQKCHWKPSSNLKFTNSHKSRKSARFGDRFVP